MTTICWDGKVLAADRMATYGDFKHPVTKIWRLPDGSLVGGAGEYSFILAMVEWLGGRASEFPASQRDKDDWQPILHITTSGKVHIYERTPFPLRSHATQFAVGSGKQYALAAMHMGAGAVEAVEVAAHFDPNTGLGVEFLSLAP